MRKKILVPYQIPQEGIASLYVHFDVYYPEKGNLTKEEIIELIPDYHGVVSLFTQPFTRDIIEAGKQLEIISNYGVGVNNIDVEAATEKGIVVTNTPESVCEPTAELAFTLMLSAMRRVAECDRNIRTNKGFKWELMENLGSTTWGKIIGIIGMGKIGKAIARRANAFGMKVIYHNRHQLSSDIEKEYNATYVNLDDLLIQSDIVNLSCPYTPDTHHLLSIIEFEQMKPSAFVINTARGPVIEEGALVNALKTKEIAGAGLDVYENEPEIHPGLLDMDNVVLVPHIGTATTETRVESAREAAKNVISFFTGDEDISIVNPEVLD